MNKSIMKLVGFEKEVIKVEKRSCPFCGIPINIQDFRNEISLKEYKISGLCQVCQDSFFGKD